MTAYILRRLLLMIPTLLGILLVSFVVVQFVVPIRNILVKVDFFRRPKTGFGLFVPFPYIVVFDGKNHKPVFIFL